jgi:hypothetical protein
MTAVLLSRFTPMVAANPSTRSVISAGIVTPASENMLNAKVLPDVAVPFGVLSAGPYSIMSNDRVDPYVNPSK